MEANADPVLDEVEESPEDGAQSFDDLVDEIQALFDECLAEGLEYALPHIYQFDINQEMVNGRQDTRLDTQDGQFYQDSRYRSTVGGDGLPYSPVILVGGITETIVSLTMKDDPSVYAVAPGNSVQHKIGAGITNAIIENQRDRLDSAAVQTQVVYYGWLGGTSAGYEYWDPVTKSPVWRALSVKDYLIDPSVDSELKSQWYIIRSFIIKSDAETLLKNGGYDEEPTITDWYDGNRQKRKGVECYHFYHKPNTEWPQGFLAQTVNGKVVEIGAYPKLYHIKENPLPEIRSPLCFFKVRLVSNSGYGRTPLTDCIHLQRALNDAHSRKLKLVEDYTTPTRLVPTGQQDHDFSLPGVIPVDPTSSNSFGFVQPVPIPAQIDAEIEYLTKAIYAVFGVNEGTAGQQAASDKSGKAIEDEANLDALKNATATRSFKKMVLDLWTNTIKDIQVNTTDQQIASITDDDTQTSLSVPYTKMDIEGIGIRLEPQSELEGRQAAKIQDANQRLQQGLITPVKADQLSGSLQSTVSQSVAAQAIDSYLKTNTLEIDKDTVDPEIFLSVLEQRMETAWAQQNRKDIEGLMHLKQQYTQLVLAPAQQAPGAAASTPPVAQSKAPGLAPPAPSELGPTPLFPKSTPAPHRS